MRAVDGRHMSKCRFNSSVAFSGVIESVVMR